MLTKRIHNPVDSLLVVLILPDYSKPKFITVRKREFSLFFPVRNNDNKPGSRKSAFQIKFFALISPTWNEVNKVYRANGWPNEINVTRLPRQSNKFARIGKIMGRKIDISLTDHITIVDVEGKGCKEKEREKKGEETSLLARRLSLIPLKMLVIGKTMEIVGSWGMVTILETAKSTGFHLGASLSWTDRWKFL